MAGYVDGARVISEREFRTIVLTITRDSRIVDTMETKRFSYYYYFFRTHPCTLVL